MKKTKLDKEQILNKLNEVSIFKYLARDEINEIINDAEIEDFVNDEHIITLGKENKNLYIILDGFVNVTVNPTNEEKESFICSIGENDLFGEAGLFLNTKSIANITAIDKVKVLAIKNTNMIDFIKNNPVPGNKILILLFCRLSERLAITNQELAQAKRFEFDQSKIDDIVMEFLIK